MADEIILSSDGSFSISVKYVDRSYIRVAFETPEGTYYFDSVTGLDQLIDVLDWHEVMVSVNTVTGDNKIYINKVDRTGLDGTVPANAQIQHNNNTDLTFGGLNDLNTASNLVGSIQEVWMGDGAVNWPAVWDTFSPGGYPGDLGVDNAGGSGVVPYLYLNRKLGQGFLQNQGSAAGVLTEVLTLSEAATIPTYPGATPPAGTSPDDTFQQVNALLGDEEGVPPAVYGTQQVFDEQPHAKILDAIGSLLLSQTETSPASSHPLTVSSLVQSGTVGLKGGIFRKDDAFDETLDALRAPVLPVGLTVQTDGFRLDGARFNNNVTAFRFTNSPSSSALNQPPGDEGQGGEYPDPGGGTVNPPVTTYSTQIYNTWVSYGRDLSLNNNEGYLPMVIEDSLFDGVHSFLSAVSGQSTEDQALRIIEIRNSLIWLRRLPYPLGHSGKNLGTNYPGSPGADPEAWGHGFLFNWDLTNGPSLQIHDCIFYIEDYAATTGAYGTWDDNAATTIGFPDRIQSSGNNQVIFGHPTDTYNPAWIPVAHQANFTITNYSADANAPKVFFDARNQWIADHSLVGLSGNAVLDGPIDYTAALNKPYVPYPF